MQAAAFQNLNPSVEVEDFFVSKFTAPLMLYFARTFRTKLKAQMLVEGIVKGAGTLVAKEVRQVELRLCKPEPTTSR